MSSSSVSNQESQQIVHSGSNRDERSSMNPLLNPNIRGHVVFFRKQLAFQLLPSKGTAAPWFRQDSPKANLEEKVGQPFTKTQTFLLIIAIILYILDVGTDILVAWVHLSRGDPLYCWVTLGIVLFAGLSCAACNLWWYSQGDRGNGQPVRIWACRAVFSLLFLGPVVRYCRSVRQSLLSSRKEKDLPVKRRHLARWEARCELADGAALRLIQAFLESAPQLVLQSYLLLRLISRNPSFRLPAESTHIVILQCLSIGLSLLSVTLAVVMYSKASRLLTHPEETFTLPPVLLQLAWRLLEITGRVAAFILFLYVYQAWLGLVLALHWLLMVIWCLRITENLCRARAWQVAQAAFHGYIWTFCYLDGKDRRTRKRYFTYYFLVAMENVALAALCFPLSLAHWMSYVQAILIGVAVGCLLLSLIAMVTYYFLCHPRGRRSMPVCLPREFWCSCEDICHMGDRVQDREVEMLPAPPRSSLYERETSQPTTPPPDELDVAALSPLLDNGRSTNIYQKAGATNEAGDMPAYTAPEPYEIIGNDEDGDVPMAMRQEHAKYAPWPQVADLRYHVTGVEGDSPVNAANEIAAWPDNAISLTGRALPNYRPPPMDTRDLEPMPVFVSDSAVKPGTRSLKMRRMESLPSYDAPEAPMGFNESALSSTGDGRLAPQPPARRSESVPKAFMFKQSAAVLPKRLDNEYTEVIDNEYTDVIGGLDNELTAVIEEAGQLTVKIPSLDSLPDPPALPHKEGNNCTGGDNDDSSSDDEVVSRQLPSRQSIVSPKTVESFYMSNHFSSTPKSIEEEPAESGRTDCHIPPSAKLDQFGMPSVNSTNHSSSVDPSSCITPNVSIRDTSSGTLISSPDEDTPMRAMAKEDSDKENSADSLAFQVGSTPKKGPAVHSLREQVDISTPERQVLLSDNSKV